MIEELIFVYNADAGRWNAYMDMLHKVFSPKTYPCKLCAITYGVFSIEKEWEAFVETLPVKTTFLHRDEWEAAYTFRAPLPAIFAREGDTISVWLSAEKMADMSLEDLMGYVARVREG